jgi:hypothetical protein
VIVAMMAMLLMSALGTALVLATSSETMIAGNFRDGSEGIHAAEAAAGRALADLQAVSDWSPLFAGTLQSAFVDGFPGGSRTLPDGSIINLTEEINTANCGKKTTCSAAEMNAKTAERPWGANNPRWRLYAYGNLNELTNGSINSPFYGIVMVADDPSETDDDPTIDGAEGTSPGWGVLGMRAEAIGARGAHAVVSLTIARRNTTDAGAFGVRVLSWRVGQ